MYVMLDHSKDGYRAKIILLSYQRCDVRQIERAIQVFHKTCLKWVRAFNEQGVVGIRTRPKGGSKPDFPPEARGCIVAIARTSPRKLGLAFGTWSLRTLVWHITQKDPPSPYYQPRL